jgi:hypothetical protein
MIGQPERRHGVQIGDKGPAGEHRVVQHDNGVIGQDGERHDRRATASSSATKAASAQDGERRERRHGVRIGGASPGRDG